MKALGKSGKKKKPFENVKYPLRLYIFKNYFYLSKTIDPLFLSSFISEENKMKQTEKSPKYSEQLSQEQIK